MLNRSMALCLGTSLAALTLCGCAETPFLEGGSAAPRSSALEAARIDPRAESFIHAQPGGDLADGFGNRIILKTQFAERYALKATIEASYTVDKAHAKPNPAAKDGDMHIAGRSDDIGLACVAEIMNAAHQTRAVNRVHEVEGKGQPVTVDGAWRLWPEHGGNTPQRQGQHLDPFTTTNPDHVFEIHPVTKFDGIDTTDGVDVIEGFETKDAETAFHAYENQRCHLSKSGDTVTIQTSTIGYNYAEFVVAVTDEQPLTVDDGAFVRCNVYTTEGELLVRNRRMVSIKGTASYAALTGAKKGDALHVLGIPRVDLSILNWRIKQMNDGHAEVADWGLPYEMIVVGVYPDHPTINN